MSKRILKQYCTKNFRKIRHRKGFGVHSPFAYNLITKVIEETYSYYAYQQIEEVWHTRVCNQLTQDDFQRRKPVSEKYGRLLFRMVNRFHPDIIFEYGSCWGISSLCLYLGNTRSQLFCADPDTRIYNFSKDVIPSDLQNIHFFNSYFSEGLSECLKFGTPDFICIHRPSDIQEYGLIYNRLFPCLGEITVILIEGIHSESRALDAWRRFISDERIRVTMDLFDLGIAFCDPKLNKQDYIVAF